MHTIDINTILGLLISALLAILLAQVRATKKSSDAMGDKLDAHILEITKTMALKVDLTGCRTVRGECIELNKKLIVNPLEKALGEIEGLRKESWQEQRRENRLIWMAIRAHGHTSIESESDQVVLPKDLSANQ